MSRCSQPHLLIGLMLFLVVSGCSRPTPGVPAESPTSAAQTPFDDRARNSNDEAPQTTAFLEKSISSVELPFEGSQVLPAGSLLTVRLRSSIMAVNEGPKQTFEAVVDESVEVEGMTLIPRGTVASGKIGSVSVSNLRPDRGYVRLALETVNRDGLDLPVQTAILFARQISGDIQAGVIHLEKGRRLTFRLTEPCYLGAQHSSAGH